MNLEHDPAEAASLGQDIPVDADISDNDDSDDECNIANVDRQIWLAKIPKFLLSRWQESAAPGAVLGRVRVFDELDANGNPKVAILLPESPLLENVGPTDLRGHTDNYNVPKKIRPVPEIPTEFGLSFVKAQSSNLLAFGEQIMEDVDEYDGEVHRSRKTSMLGTIHHECSVTPSLITPENMKSYSNIMRARRKVAEAPTRTTKRLDVDQSVANRLAAGGNISAYQSDLMHTRRPITKQQAQEARAVRMDRPQLLDKLFSLFAESPYWSLKILRRNLNQPEAYLREVLSDIADLIRSGPYSGYWALKPEWVGANDDEFVKVDRN